MPINETFNLKLITETFKCCIELSVVSKSIYIGQTSRNLISRLKNHEHDSVSRQETDDSKHLTENPDHKINLTEVEILANRTLS